MKLLIVGGVLKEGGDEERCARALGNAVTSKGHTLLNGCYNSFDRIVAEAAMETAQA